MIVLDEQLLGRQIDYEIKKWYQGSVVFVRDLRPGSLVKDDAIPQLLRKKQKPTFVTINTIDFWQKVAADKKFCIVCFSIKDREVPRIPSLLKLLLKHDDFRSKANRSGYVLRVTLKRKVRYYRWNDDQVHEITL